MFEIYLRIKLVQMKQNNSTTISNSILFYRRMQFSMIRELAQTGELVSWLVPLKVSRV